MTEWTNFSTNLVHGKKWRYVGQNIEIEETIAFPPDQHGVIIQAETWKQQRWFNVPDHVTKMKNPVISHTVNIKHIENTYYEVIINTVMQIKYIKINRHVID